MNSLLLDEMLEYQDHDRAEIDDMASRFGRGNETGLTLYRSWAAIRRWKNLGNRYGLLLPTINIFLGLEDEEMLPVSNRTETQWELTSEGTAWFESANWSSAAEAYIAAVQLAILNMDLVSATQNAANAAICCAAELNPRDGLAWSHALIDWAVKSGHPTRGSILAQALTAGRACLVRAGKEEDAAIDGSWVVARIGSVSRVPFDAGIADAVAKAMMRVGEVEERREWRRIMQLLMTTGSRSV